MTGVEIVKKYISISKFLLTADEIYFFEQAQLLIEFVMFQFNLHPFIMMINIAC